MKMVALTTLIILSLALAACGPDQQTTVTVSDVWGRPSPQAATNAAFYMKLENATSSDDSLTSATIPICTKTELHETTIDDQGVMSMQHINAVSLPKGQRAQLEPGGLHIMCVGLQAELNLGDHIPITLAFTNTGELQVEAEIREP